MTSRERVLTALRHEKPDRVPLMELWIDPKVVQALLPGGTSNDVAVELGMDVVTVATMVYRDDEVEWVDREQGLFRDKWGALQTKTAEAIPIPTRPSVIDSEADLAAYTPPDPRDSPILPEIRALREKHPDKAVAVVGEGGWATAVWIRSGLENVFLDMALRPDFLRGVLQIGIDYYAELFRLALAAGADTILMGDDYAGKTGTMMSPKQFEELILPGDAAVVDAIKKAGGTCIKHSDGDLWSILDRIVGTGIDMLGPLEPNCGMDLAAVWERYEGKVSVMGNVDVDLLSRGSREDVIAVTKDLLARASVNGGHIMSSGNSISSSVSPDNFVAMVETTREFGTYPIDLDALRRT